MVIVLWTDVVVSQVVVERTEYLTRLLDHVWTITVVRRIPRGPINVRMALQNHCTSTVDLQEGGADASKVDHP